MKKIIAIVFVALLVLSWYSSLSQMKSVPEEYEAHLKKAEEQESRGVYIGAVEEYKKALEIAPENTELKTAIARNYQKMGDDASYISAMKELADGSGETAENAFNEVVDHYIAKSQKATAFKYAKSMKETFPDRTDVNSRFYELRGTYKKILFSAEEIGFYYKERIMFKKDGHYGLADGKAEAVMPAEYAVLEMPYGDGYALTVLENGQIVYVDKKGRTRVALDDDIEDAGILANGRISAVKDGRYGYLDGEGIPVSDFVYEELSAFHEVGAGKKNGKWALIDKKGNPITEFIYDDVILDEYGLACNQERLFVKTDGSYHMINTAGEAIGTQVWDDVKLFRESGYAAVCRAGLWGFTDAEGNEVIKCCYPDARSFSNGYAAVYSDGLWGYIDKENSYLIEPEFLEAGDFSKSGITTVKKPASQEKTADTPATQNSDGTAAAAVTQKERSILIQLIDKE